MTATDPTLADHTHPGSLALITGGGRGLGRQAALHLARLGWDVIITFRSGEEEAQAVVAQIAALGRHAHALRLDTGRSETFGAFVTRLREHLEAIGRPHLNALLNNAGLGLSASFAQTSESQFDELMRVHLKGVFFLTQALLPLIADGGAILNVSSGLTRFSLPGHAAYAAMKGAVEVLSRYLAKELGPRGIRVNVLAPGAIETDFGGGEVRDNRALNAMIAAQTALGRVGLPQDIGDAVAALLGPQTGWITGQRIEASGGMFL